MSAELAELPTPDQLRLDAERPWPGLVAFREADAAFFHGRDSDIGNLYRMVMRERLTVLFGMSGLGKTSLLQAGLFPKLRDENLLPIRIRLDYADQSPPLTCRCSSTQQRKSAHDLNLMHFIPIEPAKRSH